MTLTEQWQHNNYLQLYFIDFGIEHDIQLKGSPSPTPPSVIQYFQLES